MIVIEASMTARAGRQDAAMAALKAAMAGSQSEPGCITYRYTASITEPDVYHIIEIWQTEAALQEHLKGEAFAEFMATAIGQELVDPIGMSAWSGDLQPYKLAIG